MSLGLTACGARLTIPIDTEISGKVTIQNYVEGSVRVEVKATTARRSWTEPATVDKKDKDDANATERVFKYDVLSRWDADAAYEVNVVWTPSEGAAIPAHRDLGTISQDGLEDIDFVIKAPVLPQELAGSLTAGSATPVAGIPVTFTFGATGGSGTYTNFAINFGDGSAVSTSPTAGTADHSYTTVGTYTATLTVTDSAGATRDDAEVITVTTPPLTASLTADNTSVDVGAPVTFTFSASGGSGTYTNFALNYGDSSSESSATPGTKTHSYANAGTYTATLTVTDSAGATKDATIVITVA